VGEEEEESWEDNGRRRAVALPLKVVLPSAG
jgi:hypothetical protein